MTDASFRFTHAITRRPARSITQGLRAIDTGTPDLTTMQAHHAAYIATLRATGATVIDLDPLDAYPDSVFVEDTALCLPQGAIIMRPGAPTRLGEAAEMAPHLQTLYTTVAWIKGPGTIEGGDILVTGREILVAAPPAPTPPESTNSAPSSPHGATACARFTPPPASCISRPTARFWMPKPSFRPNASPPLAALTATA